MFIPFTKEEVTDFRERNKLYIFSSNKNYEVTYHYIRCLTKNNNVFDVGKFNALKTDLTFIASNFDITEETEKFSSRYKYLFLTLSLRETVKVAINKKFSTISVYTTNQMIPDVFVDEGFNIRKSARGTTFLYRGTKSI